jgi:hypothetical protein
MVKQSKPNFVNRTRDLSELSHTLLHNQFVLYGVFIIAVGNLFHFVFSNDLMSVGISIATGLLTSFFSKNMVVIMILSMVVANIYRVGYGKPEGFENSEQNDDGEEKEGEEEEGEYEEGEDLEEQFNTALKELEELAKDEDEKEEGKNKKEGFKINGNKLVKLGKDYATLEKRVDVLEKKNKK